MPPQSAFAGGVASVRTFSSDPSVLLMLINNFDFYVLWTILCGGKILWGPGSIGSQVGVQCVSTIAEEIGLAGIMGG